MPTSSAALNLIDGDVNGSADRAPQPITDRPEHNLDKGALGGANNWESDETSKRVSDETDNGNLDYVTFFLAGELFAFPMAQVNEIVRMPQLVRVPLSPVSLEGLANLRGQVLPVVDLRRCCGLPEAEHDDATRVIVVNCGSPLGVVVDRVAAVLSVEPDEVADVAAIRSTIDSDLLTAVLRPAASEQMVSVLDVVRLVDAEFPSLAKQIQATGISVGDFGAVSSTPSSSDSDDVVELVSFVVDGQEYALPIQQVQEIVQSPDSVSHVPNSDSRVMGVMDLRGALLPVVSLRRIFNLPQADLDTSNRVVVVHLQEEGTGKLAAVGVVMDTVREVLRVPRELVDQLPQFLSQSGQLAEVESVCRLEGGNRVVSVLSAERLFAGRGLRAALESQLESRQPLTGASGTSNSEEAEENAMDSRAGEKPPIAEEQLVVFRVEAEEYCVHVDAVQEIIRVPEQLIRVPKALSFVEGLVNLRGSVLPVVNLRSRLGLPRLARDDRQRIVVLIISGIRTGFIVDSVVEVIKLESSSVEGAPHLLAQQSSLITEVANLTQNQRMLLILQPEQLLGGEEMKALQADSEHQRGRAA